MPLHQHAQILARNKLIKALYLLFFCSPKIKQEPTYAIQGVEGTYIVITCENCHRHRLALRNRLGFFLQNKHLLMVDFTELQFNFIIYCCYVCTTLYKI